MTDTYDGILARMQQKFQSLAGYSPDEASDIGIRLKVLAGEIYSVCAAVDWLKTQTFAQTATGAQLEMRAQERGLPRKPAAAASGTLTFGRGTALWFGVSIPKGTVCASSGVGAVRYVTTQDAVLPQGSLSADVPAMAEEAGTAGNTNSATVTVLVTPPASIETVTNPTAFTGGENAESDDSLRARLLAAYAAPANGTNAAWYRQAAMACDGIHSANVVPRANGVGTVAVYLGGKGAAPSSAQVQAVSDMLNTAKEINVNVTVQAARTAAVDVACTVKKVGAVTDAATVTVCRQAILDYFSGLEVGEAVTLSAMTAKLFDTGLISDCSFSTAGKTAGADQLAVIGVLTVTAGS